MFESSPQTKIAMAYSILRADGSKANIVTIFAVATVELTSILLCPDEITQMCTAGSADSLLLGSKQGSFFLYDLRQVDEGNKQ